MKHLFLFVTAVLLSPAVINAAYFASDYDQSYTPYNLQTAIDSLDYDSCVAEVKDFDRTYNEYLRTYGTPISVGDTVDIQFGALLELYEEEFRQCLIDLRVKQQQESVDECDFDVIESLSNTEQRSYRTEIKSCNDQQALSSCDQQYIEEMDGSDKFTFRNEIDVCEMEWQPVVAEPVAPVPVELAVPVVAEQPVVEEIVAIAAPVQIEQTVRQSNTSVPVTVEDTQIDLPVSTSTDEADVFTLTEVEIDALVNERLAEITTVATTTDIESDKT